MKLIFKKDLFLKDINSLTVDKDLIQCAIGSWVDECDGKEAEIKIGNYSIHGDWCEIVEE